MPFQFRKEAIEEDLNTNFPSQGQGNPPLYYSLSEVVVPTYSINSVAEGSGLPQNLQTAWDFSTGFVSVNNGTNTTIINNTGFWLVDLLWTGQSSQSGTTALNAQLFITDSLANKTIWRIDAAKNIAVAASATVEQSFVVFLKSGESLVGKNQQSNYDFLNVWYRQIAAVNGTLVNPLGYSAA